MGSGIFFPICAIPFSILINILFFKKGHIDNYETRIYKALIISNLVGLILELLCTVGSLIYSNYHIVSDFIYKSYTVTAISLVISSSFMICSISSHLPPASPQPIRGICTLALWSIANRATSFKHCRTAS